MQLEAGLWFTLLTCSCVVVLASGVFARVWLLVVFLHAFGFWLCVLFSSQNRGIRFQPFVRGVYFCVLRYLQSLHVWPSGVRANTRWRVAGDVSASRQGRYAERDLMERAKGTGKAASSHDEWDAWRNWRGEGGAWHW